MGQYKLVITGWVPGQPAKTTEKESTLHAFFYKGGHSLYHARPRERVALTISCQAEGGTHYIMPGRGKGGHSLYHSEGKGGRGKGWHSLYHARLRERGELPIIMTSPSLAQLLCIDYSVYA